MPHILILIPILILIQKPAGFSRVMITENRKL